MSLKKILVTVISGFLGAGKTTLINYVLTHHTGNYAWKVSTESGKVLFSIVKWSKTLLGGHLKSKNFRRVPCHNLVIHKQLVLNLQRTPPIKTTSDPNASERVWGESSDTDPAPPFVSRKC